MASADPGRDREPRSAGALVLAAGATPAGVAPASGRAHRLVALDADAHVRQQTGEQRAVHRVGLCGRAVARHPEVLGDLPQLRVQVLPLADPQVVQELAAAHPAERVAGQPRCCSSRCAHRLRSARKSECGSANRRCCSSAACLRVGGRSRGSCTDSAATMTSTSRRQPSASAGHQHPRQPRVDRRAAPAAGRSRSAEVGAPLGSRAPSSCEQLHAVGDLAPVRRDRGTGRPRTSPSRSAGHPQDHRRQVGAQDLRIGELRPAVEVLLAVEPDADAGLDAAAAARALVGGGLRDRLDRQPLHLGAAGCSG